MYCPNCELEIKGEEKSQCPICNSSLIESPFETPMPVDDMSDTELKLKELIRDIDEKVSKNLEETTAEQEFKLDNFKLDVSEPSVREFELDLTGAKPENHAETSEDQIFNLSDDQQEISSKPKEPVFDVADMDTLGKQNDMQEPSETVTETASDIQDAAEATRTQPEKTPAMEIDDTVEIARFNVKPPKEDISTKAILDQALDELETDEKAVVKTKKKSLAMPVLVGSFLLALVIGAGMYVLNYMSEPVSVTPSKKDSLVLKKTAPGVPAKQPPAAKKQSVTPDNQTQAVAQANMPQPPAAATSEKTGIAQPPAQAEKPPVVQDSVPQPSAVQPPEEKKETALMKESDQQKTAAVTKEIAALKETPPEKQPPAQKEPEAVKESEPKTLPPAQQEVAPKKTVLPSPVSATQKESTKAIPGTFTIHAGSYRTEKTAAQEVRRLNERGFAAYTEKTDLGVKGIWYRVKIGSFSSRSDAEKALQQFTTREQQDARIIKNK